MRIRIECFLFDFTIFELQKYTLFLIKQTNIIQNQTTYSYDEGLEDVLHGLTRHHSVKSKINYAEITDSSEPM